MAQRRFKTRIKRLLAMDISIAMEVLDIGIRSETDKYDEFILYHGRYNRLNYHFNKNLIARDDYQIELSKITNSLIELINKLESGEFETGQLQIALDEKEQKSTPQPEYFTEPVPEPGFEAAPEPQLVYDEDAGPLPPPEYPIRSLFDCIYVDVPPGMENKIHDYVKHSVLLKQVIFTKSGGWLILSGDNGYWLSDIPLSLERQLEHCYNEGLNVKYVAITNNSGWIVLSGWNTYWCNDIPPTCEEKLQECQQKGEAIHRVAFHPDGGWVILKGETSFWVYSIPKDLEEKMFEMNKDELKVSEVIFASSGGWLITVGKNGYWYSAGIPELLAKHLGECHDQNIEIRQVAISPTLSWTMITEP